MVTQAVSICTESQLFSIEKTIMNKKDLYQTAHLVVAAIRVLEHRDGIPPSIESLQKALNFSLEECHFLCRKLHQMGIIDIVEGSFGVKLFIKNHIELENIPKTQKDTGFQEDIDRFMGSKKDYSKEIETIKANQERKQKDLFARIDEKLKKGLADKS
jgi:hypothetical protein